MKISWYSREASGTSEHLKDELKGS